MESQTGEDLFCLCRCIDVVHLNSGILRFTDSSFTWTYMSLICNLVKYFLTQFLSFIGSRHRKRVLLGLKSLLLRQDISIYKLICYSEAWRHLLSQNSPYWSWREHMTEETPTICDTLSSAHGDLSRDAHETSGSLSEHSPRSFLTRDRKEECPSLFGDKIKQVLNSKLPVVMFPRLNEERLIVVKENKAELRENKISKI